jgi:hypothetical protein
MNKQLIGDLFAAAMGRMTGSTSREFSEKFAELIVRECIAQCEKNAEHEYLGAGSKLSAFNIREHFGVEE